MCSGKRKRPATDEDADLVAANGSASTGETPVTFFTAGLQPPMAKPSEMMAAAAEPSEPIPVYTGPTKTGTALIAAVAADTEQQTPPKRGKKSKIAAKKPDAAASKATASKAEAGAKPAKPAAVRHANARPEAAVKPAASAEKKPAAKPAAAAADKSAPKPAKPKAAAKPKGENKPAG
jgi:D-alanyl-D-alanine carboxypeptidase